MQVRTIEGSVVEIDRKALLNAGNMNGDVRCVKCREPCERLYVVEDFTDTQIEKYVVLSEQRDAEGSGEFNRVHKLDGCEACDDND